VYCLYIEHEIREADTVDVPVSTLECRITAGFRFIQYSNFSLISKGIGSDNACEYHGPAVSGYVVFSGRQTIIAIRIIAEISFPDYGHMVSLPDLIQTFIWLSPFLSNEG